MTSGRLACSDCGRNSPQGRHVRCAVLAALRAPENRNPPGVGHFIEVSTLHFVVCGRSCTHPYPQCDRISRAVRALVADGYRIDYFGRGSVGGGAYRFIEPQTTLTATPLEGRSTTPDSEARESNQGRIASREHRLMGTVAPSHPSPSSVQGRNTMPVARLVKATGLSTRKEARPV